MKDSPDLSLLLMALPNQFLELKGQPQNLGVGLWKSKETLATYILTVTKPFY